MIAILFAALIGPYFIDWTAYRDTFERQASAAIGRPVTVAGKASVRLLPTPVVSLTDVRIGGGAEPDIQMERFRAEVELAPLLKGEVRIIQMTVERPRFRVDLAALLGETARDSDTTWRIDPASISLARLEVIGGTALIQDSRAGRSWRAEGLAGVVEASSLRGPAKVDARFTLDGRPVAIRAGFGRMDDNHSVTASVTLTSPLYPATLSTDGLLTFASGSAPTYAGSVSLIGDPVEEGNEAARTAWADFRTVGAFELTPEALSVTEAQVSYGATERPLILAGAGRIEIGAEPRFNLAVNARQIDVDRALGGGADGPVAIEAALAALAARLPDLPTVTVPGTIRANAQGVVVGGSVIQAVDMNLATTEKGWRIDGLHAELPGETQFDLSGALDSAEAAGFSGHGRIASDRPAALAAWWRGQAGSATAISNFVVEADIELAPGIQRLSDITATTGNGSVRGSVDLRRFEQSDQLFVTVDLDAERADLVEARALTELLVGSGLSSGAIDQMTFSLQADALSAAGIEARTVVLDGGLENGELQLRRMSIGDLAGAGIEVSGRISDPFGSRSGQIEASILADDISGAAAFLAGLMPDNQAVGRLVAAAPSISPVQLDISAGTGGSEKPLSLALTGTFAGTHVTITASGAGQVSDLSSLQGTLNAHVDSENSASLLTQIGLDPLPLNAGPVDLNADFSGRLADAGSFKVEGTVAGISVSYDGQTGLKDGEIQAAGTIRAESADLDPALLLAGLAVPGLGEGHAAAGNGRLVAGGNALTLSVQDASFDGQPVVGEIQATFADGIHIGGSLDLQAISFPALAAIATGASTQAEAGGWSDTAFAATLPSGLSVALAVKAGVLDLGVAEPARNAAVALDLSAGAFNLDLAKAEFAGGTLQGAIAGTMNDGQASVTVRGTMQSGQLQALVWERGGLPIASGAIDGAFDVSGHGRTMTGLVSSLTGNGSFAVSEGRLNALNPEALTAVMEAAGGDETPDAEQARETFAILFGSGALPFDRAAGSFTLSEGVARIATVSLESGSTTVLADAAIDLNAAALTSTWSVRTGEGEKNPAGAAGSTQPQVSMTFSGPIYDPERRVDLEPLLQLLQSRYLQRRLDELEGLEKARAQSEAALQLPAATTAPIATTAPTPAETAAPSPQPSSPAPAPAVPTQSEPEQAAVPLPPVEAPLSLLPQELELGAPGSDVIRQMSPAVEDMMTGTTQSAGSPGPAAPAPAPVSVAPPRAQPAEAEARQPPRTQPAPPRRAAPAPRRALLPFMRPRAGQAVQPPRAPTAEVDAYRTLPNGVTIKVR